MLPFDVVVRGSADIAPDGVTRDREFVRCWTCAALSDAFPRASMPVRQQHRGAGSGLDARVSFAKMTGTVPTASWPESSSCAVQQVVRYLRYTGNRIDLVVAAALDPQETVRGR